MRWVYAVTGLLLFIGLGTSWAEPLVTENKKFFDAPAATTEVEKIQAELNKPGVILPQLKSAVDVLDKYLSKAKSCVTQSQEQIDTIKKFVKDTNLDLTAKPLLPDVQYLTDRLKFYSEHLSECRLFVFRLQEEVHRDKDVILKLSAHKLLQRSTPIWKIVDPATMSQGFSIHWNTVYKVSGLDELNSTVLFLGMLVILFAVVMGVIISVTCHRWLVRHERNGVHDLVYSLVSTIKYFIVPILVLASTSLFLTKIFSVFTTNPALQLLSYSALIYILVVGLSKFLFDPPQKAENALGLTTTLGRSAYRRALMITTWVWLGYVSTVILRDQVVSQEVYEVIRTIYFMVLSVSIIWFFWLVSHTAAVIKWNHSIAEILKIFLGFLLISLLTIESIGYYHLALFAVTGILLTSITVAVAVGTWMVFDGIFEIIDDKQYAIARQLREWFGVKLHRRIHEISLVKFVVYVVLAIAFFVNLLTIWDISANVVDSLVDGALNGFSVGGLTIIPSKILSGILAFCVVSLLGRWIATITARRHRFSDEQETQVAVSSIIIYISFSVALIVAFMIAGVNFTGLAIIAGALSVGIGLGLQNIVNNFASGLILLLEKPIKPGDRVKVGEMEGVVKKIRIRSTQIVTNAYEDIIVPNSDMITSQVTNYMFRDKLWRWICPILVAYDNDMKVVEKILIDVAESSPDLLKDGRNKPCVYFRNIGENGMLFELWCVIADVNKRVQVQNDLNYSIEIALREHGIKLGCQRRDVILTNQE